jgi:hypothetical protein
MLDQLILIIDALIAQGVIPQGKRAAIVAALTSAFNDRNPPNAA